MAATKTANQVVSLKEETSTEYFWREVFQDKESTRNFRLEMKLSNEKTKYLSLIADNKSVAFHSASDLIQKIADDMKLERAFWRFCGTKDWNFVSAKRKESKLKFLKNKVSKAVDYFFDLED
ncbi:hypothetical protein [Viridibacillus arvi]|uniref:hypothetical protein n=1 Tax=Viridibacillus arvi TaxID=263475 RepID=UPI003D2743A2